MARARRWILTIMVIAFALLAGACSSSDDTTNDTDAATDTTVAAIEETTTTTEVATTVSDAQSATIAAYETAWNDGDEDAFRALFTPGAVIEVPVFFDSDDIDRLVMHSAGHRTMGTELSIDGCIPSGENVISTGEFDGLVPIAMNHVPWRDRYIFSFEDEQITHMVQSCIICWDGEADTRLTAWVKTVDPTAVDVLAFGYNLPNPLEKAAAWLEWAPKWQEAGRP